MRSPQVTGSETTSSTTTAPSITTTITTTADKQLTPVARRPQFRTPLGENVQRKYCHVRGALNTRARTGTTRLVHTHTASSHAPPRSRVRTCARHCAAAALYGRRKE
ncbi:unnamed protein product [Macrosiphum euphorbiae]|uniref:Uncharacterized protein n=1 Tax=Macrosiphum euphorbiae TaxID=13131 RepID=A0AAV0WET8_9HEMI|nr:unnamed protein product [Macrosiphum euphorbiae]